MQIAYIWSSFITSFKKVAASEISSRLATQRVKFQTNNIEEFFTMSKFCVDTFFELVSPPDNCIVHRALVEFSRL